MSVLEWVLVGIIVVLGGCLAVALYFLGQFVKALTNMWWR